MNTGESSMIGSTPTLILGFSTGPVFFAASADPPSTEHPAVTASRIVARIKRTVLRPFIALRIPQHRLPGPVDHSACRHGPLGSFRVSVELASTTVGIISAGPAGLTLAVLPAKAAVPCVAL